MVGISKLAGIILVVMGAVEMVVLPRILTKGKDENAARVVGTVVWLSSLATVVIGVLFFLGVFGEF